MDGLYFSYLPVYSWIVDPGMAYRVPCLKVCTYNLHSFLYLSICLSVSLGKMATSYRRHLYADDATMPYTTVPLQPQQAEPCHSVSKIDSFRS